MTFKTNLGIFLFRFQLKMMSLILRLSKEKRKEIYNKDTGFIFDGKYQFKSRDGKVNFYLIFKDGKMKSRKGIIDKPNITIFYKDKETMARIYNKSAEESLDYLLTNEMSFTGNRAYLTKFSYMTTIITGKKPLAYKGPENSLLYPIEDLDKREKRRELKNETLERKVDKVQVLDEPYLSKYSIDDFPRLKYLKNRRFALKPAICAERARLLTEFHRKNGFEVDAQGNPFDPNIRQAMAISHVMVNRKPMIFDKHLLAGSTTSKEVGIPVYPELIGCAIWPELRTIANRKLNPNDISEEDADALNFEVFPYWMERNVQEYCRTKFGNPISQQLEERFVLYFMMKNNAISHTVPDFRMVLAKGLKQIQQEAADKEKKADSQDKKNFYKAIQIVTDGAMIYAKHLNEEAVRLSKTLDSNVPEQLARIKELQEIAKVCATVPANPAKTVYDAVMSIWISFTCLQIENANSALSIGRLDQLLQPYFMKDIAAAKSESEKEEVIKQTIELVGSLFLKFNDDDPLVPNVGNKLFGGTSSDDTVTVGGVDKDGNNAVCDMTYVVLKTAEIMCFQDPNMNARYYPGVNSKEYLRRLCEVNINMRASPSIHNDKQMIDALVHQGIPLEDARDWAATGCVEPTISGKHYGHTNCMLLNMVAPLEAALNNGVHPVMGETIGPQTGEVRASFATYEDFLKAYKIQLKYLIDKSIEINNYLGIAHQYVHPTPLLSAMFTGPLDKGKDIIFGGAVYNSSGVALVSITDVVDSLYVIKRLIYDKNELDFPTLMDALAKDFSDGYSNVQLKINKVPKFGSGEQEPIQIAQDLINFCYDAYEAQDNYRGGKYFVGYWSISYHVGFGMLSGALPSGRKKGKAFTPGLTPAPRSSDQILQNIHTIAALDHLKMPNNIAFNVKLVPHAGDSHDKTLNVFTSYVQGYFDEGGMQWQFNVVTTDMMRDAMDHPEDYRWLIVRISGYNAYFVKLNKNMQIELIERTEFSS